MNLESVYTQIIKESHGQQMTLDELTIKMQEVYSQLQNLVMVVDRFEDMDDDRSYLELRYIKREIHNANNSIEYAIQSAQSIK